MPSLSIRRSFFRLCRWPGRSRAAAILFITAASTSFAYADPLSERVKVQEKAFEGFKLVSLMAALAESAKPLNDDRMVELVQQIGDRQRLLDEVTYGVDDLQQLSDVCSRASSAHQFLARFKASRERVAAAEGKTADEGGEDSPDFDRQFTVLMPFMVRCMAVVTEATDSMMKQAASTRPDAVSSIDPSQMRKTLAEAVEGFALAVVALPPNYRARPALATSLAESAPIYASALRPTERQALGKRLRDISGGLPAELRASMRDAADGFISDACSQLCGLP